jgi:sugar fermentation stimulation protein A
MMRAAGLAEFPDCVTARGVKHLRELAEMVAQGHRAVMIFLIQRTDAKRLRLARDLDPAYAEAFGLAAAGGVEAMAFRCRMSPEEIALDAPVPIDR